MERGETGEDGYVEYMEAIKKAEADSEALLLEIVKRHAVGIEATKTKEVTRDDGSREITEETQIKMSWQAAAWILERRHPERWKNKELGAEEAVKILARALLEGNEDVAQQLRAALAQVAARPSA